jgi:hypothetical protein
MSSRNEPGSLEAPCVAQFVLRTQKADPQDASTAEEASSAQMPNIGNRIDQLPSRICGTMFFSFIIGEV